jgi:hypothetical protein
MMLARCSRLLIILVAVALGAALVAQPAAADPPDAKQVTLTLTGDAETGFTITIDPETAEIERGNNAKIKKVYWAGVGSEQHPEVFWELRWDPDKGGASENYFGDVDLPCGTASLKVQPDKPKIPDAQWPYAVTAYSCVDGARGERLASVDPRIVWKD